MTQDDKKVAKSSNNRYVCSYCDYSTSRKCNFLKHISTVKHRRMTNDDKSSKKVALFKCDCGRSYKYRQGLHKHQQKCDIVNKNQIESGGQEVLYDEDISKSELYHMLQQQQKVINSMVPKIGNTTINNNINIQLFLDEKCKDAMTLQHFFTELPITIQDLLEYRHGKQNGVSNLLLQNLKPIPLIDRPIHCTDIKKSTWMIKEDEGWTKDNGNKVIKVTEFEVNKRFQHIWDVAYPNWKTDEKLQEVYLELVRCVTAESLERDIEKILKRIGPEYKLNAKDIKNSFLE